MPMITEKAQALAKEAKDKAEVTPTEQAETEPEETETAEPVEQH